MCVCVCVCGCDYDYDRCYLLVDGGWTDWSTWSLCSVTCGGGGAVRRRFCTNPSPLHGGRYCEGDELENATCSTTPCPGINKTNVALHDHHFKFSHCIILHYFFVG